MVGCNTVIEMELSELVELVLAHAVRRGVAIPAKSAYCSGGGDYVSYSVDVTKRDGATERIYDGSSFSVTIERQGGSVTTP